jgi:hypothetical protein
MCVSHGGGPFRYSTGTTTITTTWPVPWLTFGHEYVGKHRKSEHPSV